MREKAAVIRPIGGANAAEQMLALVSGLCAIGGLAPRVAKKRSMRRARRGGRAGEGVERRAGSPLGAMRRVYESHSS